MTVSRSYTGKSYTFIDSVHMSQNATVWLGFLPDSLELHPDALSSKPQVHLSRVIQQTQSDCYMLAPSWGHRHKGAAPTLGAPCLDSGQGCTWVGFMRHGPLSCVHSHGDQRRVL